MIPSHNSGNQSLRKIIFTLVLFNGMFKSDVASIPRTEVVKRL